MPLHPADRIVNGHRMRWDLGVTATAGETCDRGRGHIDREQQRPDLIVQVTRQIGPLLRLQRQQPLVQPVVMRRGGVETPRHEIEAVRQPHQFRRTMHRQRRGIVVLADMLESG